MGVWPKGRLGMSIHYRAGGRPEAHSQRGKKTLRNFTEETSSYWDYAKGRHSYFVGALAR